MRFKKVALRERYFGLAVKYQVILRMLGVDDKSVDFHGYSTFGQFWTSEMQRAVEADESGRGTGAGSKATVLR